MKIPDEVRGWIEEEASEEDLYDLWGLVRGRLLRERLRALGPDLSEEIQGMTEEAGDD